MKKLFLSLTLLTVVASWSQSEKTHEIKVNALQALVVPSLEITYEYALNNTSGVGIATNIRLDGPEDDYQKFAFTPYYRQYFFNNKDYGQKGFFIEAFLQYTNGEQETVNRDPDNNPLTNNSISETESYSDIGIGFGGGLKILTSNGFTIDAVAGIGRNFKIENGSPDFFPRWGINLGYRFF